VPQPQKPLDDSASMRAWFGVELRNWREQRRLSQTDAGALVHVSGALIGKIEKAERDCPERLVDALDGALEAGGALIRLRRRVREEEEGRQADADRSATDHRRSGSSQAVEGMLALNSGALSDRSLSPMERRTFLSAGSAALTTGSLAELVPQLGRASMPKSVRREEIEQLHCAATALSRWDNLYGGGGMVRDASYGQLRWASDLLTIRCPAPLRSELFTAVGTLAIVIGASAFDAYAHDDARRLLQFASLCAEEAGNWHLRAKALDWRARQEIWCGSLDLGLTHAESGLVRSDRLTPREQSMLHNSRARALAKMKKTQDTLSAIGRSDDIFSQARPNEDLPWMAYYDNAQHYGDTGHALYDLALLTDHPPRVAAERFQTAIEGHTQAYVRSRAISATKLSSLTMATGDPQQAAAIGHRALDDVGRLSSRRAADDVRDLLNLARRHSDQSEAAELRERISTTVLV
jgi:transcriptional regulator with XRE-family HTH domain